MSVPSDIIKFVDDEIQKITKDLDIMRVIKMDVKYSLTSKNIEEIKKRFENAGFMVSLDSQFCGSYQITVSYIKNWKSE